MFFITAKRALHTAFRPPPLTADDRARSAKNALLAFNVMISQKIRPDVFMYTNLIRIMGDAGLEWQAYKFFARMLEQGVTPLPETYAALKAATHPRRLSLHTDISIKLEESWKSLPSDIAADLERNEESQRLTIANDVAKMRIGALIPSNMLQDADRFLIPEKLPASALVESTAEAHEANPNPNQVNKVSSYSSESDRNDSYATLRIDNPTLTWETFKAAQEVQGHRSSSMSAEEQSQALTALSGLHDDELRIFLAVSKQLRHGSREELLQRIVATIPYTTVMAMVSRRVDFFVYMRRQFKEVLGEESQAKSENALTTISQPGTDLAAQSSFDTISNSITSVERELERALPVNSGKSVRVLYTPWGFIKEPIFKTQAEGVINAARTIAIHPDDEKTVVEAAKANELDRISPRLLRQFARMHNIKWKRQGNEIYENVRFYVMHQNANAEEQAPGESSGSETHTESTIHDPEKISPLTMLRAMTRFNAEVKAVDDTGLNTHIKQLMEHQRRQRIQNELQRNKEKSRTKIPMLVKYRMKRAGVEPFDEVFAENAARENATSNGDPWGDETTEEDFSTSKTIFYDSRKKSTESTQRQTFPTDERPSYSETHFGRYRNSNSVDGTFSKHLVEKLESERNALLAKKASGRLNSTEKRTLSRYGLQLQRLKRKHERARQRKENPPQMVKPRVRMAKRI